MPDITFINGAGEVEALILPSAPPAVAVPSPATHDERKDSVISDLSRCIVEKRNADGLAIAQKAYPDWKYDPDFLYLYAGCYVTGLPSYVIHGTEILNLCAEALALNPSFAAVYATMANAYAVNGDYKRARMCLEQGIAANPYHPILRWNYSMFLLSTGQSYSNVTSASPTWSEYDWGMIGQGRELRDLTGLWTSSFRPENGPRPIYLWAEQGAGDAFQFCRYLKEVKDRYPGCPLILEVPRTLLAVFNTFADADMIVARPAHGGFAVNHFQCHAPLMSLPALLGEGPIREQGMTAPYLGLGLPAPEREKDGPFRIGISWQGSAKHSGDFFRSIPTDVFEDFLYEVQAKAEAAGRKVEFVPFQKGLTDSDKSTPYMKAMAAQADPLQWEDTAALLKTCDLLVTVDTGVLHLAGAMGIPAYALISNVPEWRWGLPDAWPGANTSTPWYPSVSLFRVKNPCLYDDAAGLRVDWATLLHTDVVGAIGRRFITQD